MITQTLAGRLKVALQTIEKSLPVSDDELETLLDLATVSMQQVAIGNQSGIAGEVMSVRSLNAAPVLDPENDTLMISTIRQAINRPVARGQLRKGMALPSSNIPYEDRGRTSPVVAAGPASSGQMIDMNADPTTLPRPGMKEDLTVDQWLTIGQWTIKIVGGILKKRKERRNS